MIIHLSHDSRNSLMLIKKLDYRVITVLRSIYPHSPWGQVSLHTASYFSATPFPTPPFTCSQDSLRFYAKTVSFHHRLNAYRRAFTYIMPYAYLPFLSFPLPRHSSSPMSWGYPRALQLHGTDALRSVSLYAPAWCFYHAREYDVQVLLLTVFPHTSCHVDCTVPFSLKVHIKVYHFTTSFFFSSKKGA